MLERKAIDQLEKLFYRFPDLKIFIGSGIITLKAARTILGIDRYLMYDIYAELLSIGAVKGSGATAWRATPALLEYLKLGVVNMQIVEESDVIEL